MNEKIPKRAAMLGLEQDMYAAYKIKEYAAGRTPKKFEDWKETLTDADIPKFNDDDDVKPISYFAPEKRRKRDSTTVNAKLNQIWSEQTIGSKPTMVVYDDIEKDKEVEKEQKEDQKECKHCNEVKLLSEFYKSPTTKDGYANMCKSCKKNTT